MSEFCFKIWSYFLNRNFVPRQRIDMPKLEVFSMYAHFLAEVSPLMDYIDYLNRHLQEEFTNYTKV